MERVKWRSVTFGPPALDSRAKGVGEGDLALEKQQKAREEAQIREKKRRATASKLRAGGIRIVSKLHDFGENEDCDGCIEEDESMKSKKERQMHFFKQGMARREVAASMKSKVPSSVDRHTRQLRVQSIHHKENHQAEGRILRESRIGMKMADEESLAVERFTRFKLECRQNFEHAKYFLSERMGDGFIPNQNFGRTQYFARQGLRRKKDKLVTHQPVEPQRKEENQGA